MFPAFVINLDRDVDRAAGFARRAEAAGIAVERVSGFDAAAHQGPLPEGVLKSTRYSRGAIGCALSHRSLWQRAAGSEPIIVFEDDAHVRQDFATAFADVMSRIAGFWDIVLLGYNTDSIVNLRIDGGLDTHVHFGRLNPTAAHLEAFAAARDPVVPVRLIAAFGTCGYAISPRGAQKLLAGCFPLDDRLIPITGMKSMVQMPGIDSMMNWNYPNLTAYACLPPLVLTPNDQATSTVQARPGAPARRR